MKLLSSIRQILPSWFSGNVAFITILVTGALIYVTFGPGNSLYRLVEAKIQTESAKEGRIYYEQQTEVLDARIKALKTSPDTLEKVARENFHLAGPGDDVYVVKK